MYDPEDPHSKEYDVDDGVYTLSYQQSQISNVRYPENTIITLADWYHTLAKETPLPA